MYCDGIDVSAGYDFKKITTYRECTIRHYCYFLDKRFNFHSSVFNGCYKVLIMSINFNSIAILNIYGIIIVVLSLELARAKQ